VTTTPEAEEAVAELVWEIFGTPPSIYSDVETRTCTVSEYLEQKPAWVEERSRLIAGLERIRRYGLDLGRGELSLRRVRRQDWAESWKRHFEPIEIGRALLVKPSWSRRRVKAGQVVVVLDPGLSFGTGQHATTRFCLRELARLRKANAALLDVGTGSGILAIAAAKLGYSPVIALDYDREAVAIARANARRNRVEDLIRFRHEDVTRPARGRRMRYAVVCANLIGNVLLEARERLLDCIEPGGVIIVAGILRGEFEGIRTAYEAVGVRLVAQRSEKEWCSGSFKRSRRKADE